MVISCKSVVMMLSLTGVEHVGHFGRTVPLPSLTLRLAYSVKHVRQNLCRHDSNATTSSSLAGNSDRQMTQSALITMLFSCEEDMTCVRVSLCANKRLISDSRS